MKKSILLVLFTMACFVSQAQEIKWMSMKDALTAQKKNKKPIFIDVYTVWCGPCKMVAPILEELSDEYRERIVIYKVNTDIEQELSSVFGIRSIPTLLFIDANGEPMMQPGALPKHVLRQVIDEKLLAKNITE